MLFRSVTQNMFGLIKIGLAESEDVLPIYIGDDRTDEDAFKVH